MNRCEEVRTLLKLAPEEVVARAGERLIVCEDIDALHRDFARRVADEITAANEERRLCRLILPVGPTGGYPYLAQIVAEEKIDLSSCRFFFMDDYCTPEGDVVPAEHPLSFKGVAEEIFFSHLDAARGLDRDHVVFPDEQNIGTLAERMAADGGIDACFAGLGIHGHVAFNEPEPGVAQTNPRRVTLNDFTVTINAVRAGVGGNLECFPRTALTIGMRQILSSRRIYVYVRNGTDFDWANTVLRLALFGEAGDDYPVTHVRRVADAPGGPEYLLLTDRETLSSPVNLI